MDQFQNKTMRRSRTLILNTAKTASCAISDALETLFVSMLIATTGRPAEHREYNDSPYDYCQLKLRYGHKSIEQNL